MWTILIFYFYADNLKVSIIVSINFFFEKWFKFCVKIGFEVKNLVICKDSNDCLSISVTTNGIILFLVLDSGSGSEFSYKYDC